MNRKEHTIKITRTDIEPNSLEHWSATCDCGWRFRKNVPALAHEWAAFASVCRDHVIQHAKDKT